MVRRPCDRPSGKEGKESWCARGANAAQMPAWVCVQANPTLGKFFQRSSVHLRMDGSVCMGGHGSAGVFTDVFNAQSYINFAISHCQRKPFVTEDSTTGEMLGLLTTVTQTVRSQQQTKPPRPCSRGFQGKEAPPKGFAPEALNEARNLERCL